MREELLAVVRAAPRRARDLAQPEALRPAGEPVTQIDPPRARLGTRAELRQDLGTHFIARATNTNSAMHYHVRCGGRCLALEELHPAFQDAAGCAAPPGVQQRHHSLLGNHEINRNAVGDGDGEQHTVAARGVAIHSVHDQPTVARLAMP